MKSPRGRRRGSDPALVEVFGLQDVIVVSALSPARESGGWEPTTAFSVVVGDASRSELGEALAAMLAKGSDAPHDEHDEREAALRRYSGATSRKQLVELARFVLVRRTGDAVLLRPGAPNSGGGWTTVDATEGIVVTDPSHDALGDALHEALLRSGETPAQA